ncbi:MAG: DUF222 domain-containing protein, partial [Actinomycetales bacterium]
LFDRGRAIRDFSHLANSWCRGEIAAQHVDALARLTRQYPRLVPDLVAADEAIAALARQCEPREFYQRLRQLCHHVDPDALERKGEGRGIGLHVSTMLDGLVRVDGTLDPILGASLVAALESGRRDIDPSEPDQDSVTESPGLAPPGSPDAALVNPLGDRRPLSERNLDALRRILDAAGSATGDLALPLISGERPTVNVTVPIEALVKPGSNEAAWLERFGIPTTMITGTSARQLSCDASVRPMVMSANGQLITMMPKVRTIHPALRRAVFLRDRHCRFPYCRARIDEVHHIVFHSHGGPTVMANLLGLCWNHHHRIHQAGWRITGDPSGPVAFTSSDGRQLVSGPARQSPVMWFARRHPESRCGPGSPGVRSDPSIAEGVIACRPIVPSSSVGESRVPASCIT